MGEPPPLQQHPSHQQQQCSTPPPNGPPPNDQHHADTLPPPAPFSPASELQEEARMHASADAAAASADDAADRQQQQTNAPAFWSTTRHARSASYHSLANVACSGPIQLEDHSEDQHEQSQGCWARSVTVDDYTVVSGTSGIGAYVVWHCTVRTLKGGDMNIRKRYVVFKTPHHPLHCYLLYHLLFSPCLTTNLSSQLQSQGKSFISVSSMLATTTHPSYLQRLHTISIHGRC